MVRELQNAIYAIIAHSSARMVFLPAKVLKSSVSTLRINTGFQMLSKRKNGCENKARWDHHGGTMQKGKFFATGEVFLLDIGLLMGAIVLKTAFTHLTNETVEKA